MRRLDLDSLKSILKQFRERKVMLTFHSMGDTDSVSSAFALHEYFPRSIIASPDYITSNSRRTLEKLGYTADSIQQSFVHSADLIIMLDVNNFRDCGPFKDELEAFGKPILIMDHHVLHEGAASNVSVFNDESYNSAASIVYDVLQELGFGLSLPAKKLIATGILSDSAEFRNSSPKSFMQIGEILRDTHITYPDLLRFIQHIASVENRAEAIEDLFSASVTVRSKLLFIIGTARFHANHLADDAIRIGADASLFSSFTENGIAVSARLRPPLDRERSVHLGIVLSKLAPLIGGQGGGHPCAAGAYGTNPQGMKRLTQQFISEITSRKRARIKR